MPEKYTLVIKGFDSLEDLYEFASDFLDTDINEESCPVNAENIVEVDKEEYGG